MNVYHCWYYHKEHFFALIENDCIGIAYFWFQDAHDMFYFYISFVSVMDSFISLGHIVIVIMQRCHFYFFEMNSPTTLYCFLSCCGTILSSFSCFSIVFHRRPSILTTTPSIPPVARHETSPPSLEGIHLSSFAILPPLSLYSECGLHEHTYNYPWQFGIRQGYRL